MNQSENGSAFPHRSVLYHEIILALHPISPGRYVDATIGAGGHAWGILDASSPNGALLGLDLDPEALKIASQRLSMFQNRVHLVHASYTTLREQVYQLGWDNVHGIVIDLGVSSMQLDTPERGFSFQSDGPLDMRFSPTQQINAEDLVNGWAERDLADIIWHYGEEPMSRQIARAIIQARPLHSTRQLADLIQKVTARGSGGSHRKSHIHPASDPSG